MISKMASTDFYRIKIKHIFLLLITLETVCLVYGSPDNCDKAMTCEQCISNPDCTWCSDKSTGNITRCQPRGTNNSCSSLEDPESYYEKIDDANLDTENEDSFVLIKPQRIKLNLRPGKQHSVKVRLDVGQSKQYPLDIYFLLDLSWSMKKSRNYFAEQGGRIISEIKKVTENLRIGFGSFVDKNLPPFTSTITDFNCPPENPKCTPPYSFYHQTSLTELTADDFRQEVLSAPLAGNVDEPEGGFDALMQVMVCWDRIGWRNESRKIILLATDQDFHFALDGKLVGILEPNDGQCHLNGTIGKPGYYTHSTILDYPSISHINYVAQSNAFVILFAVIPRYKTIYEEMSKLIPGSSVEILEKDAKNIVEIINRRYQSMTSSIELSTSQVPNKISTVFRSDCGSGSELVEKNKCTEVGLGKSVSFEMEVSAKLCFEKPSTFFVSLVGLNQTLTVDVDTICQCDCQSSIENGYERNSSYCNYHGDNSCGSCQCSENYSGRNCECDWTQEGSISKNKTNCISDEKSGQICNGNGKCICGKCECGSKYYGTFCECDDVSCIRRNGKLCSGNGDCRCGNCDCYPPWTGDDCSCYNDPAECSSPYDNRQCSNRGICVCSKCKCNAEDSGGVFSGEFCEVRPGESYPCSILKNCVECQAFKSGSGCDESCFFELQELEIGNDTNPDKVKNKCSFENEKGCTYFFSSVYSKQSRLEVYIHIIDGKNEDCPEINTLQISLGIFGTVLLIGLATIAFYICFIRISDYRAYVKFEEESKRMKWAVNETPLYKSPVSTYQNPMYNH